MAVWSEKERAYITWLSIPEEFRPKDLRTKREITESLGVDQDTIWAWEHKVGFWDEVFAGARSVLGREMPAMLEAMLERAKGGSVQAAKLCFQLLGVHADKLEMNVTKQDDRIILVLPEEELPE